MNIVQHVTVPLDEHDVNEEDRAIVRDFYNDACHADRCEYDEMCLEYVAARSRLNGAAIAFGIIGMALAIRETHLSKAHYGWPSAWVCTHDPKCRDIGCDCGPDCVCGVL